MSGITVVSMPLGPIQANCHILTSPSLKEAVIVDPGGEVDRIEEALSRAGCRPVALWNTHGHIDHVAGNFEVKRRFCIPTWIHEVEKEWVEDPIRCGASWLGLPFAPQPADHTWKDGDTLEALGETWRIMHVPGHSPGCSLIVCDAEKLVVGGDLLFRDSVGRVDLPFGDPKAMAVSLRRAMELPDDYRVLTGHGPDTTIGRERKSNQILRQMMRE